MRESRNHTVCGSVAKIIGCKNALRLCILNVGGGDKCGAFLRFICAMIACLQGTPCEGSMCQRLGLFFLTGSCHGFECV